MKICCGIILYNPSDSDVKNVQFYQEKFDKVYIYNNTEKNDKELNKKVKENNTSIISSGVNDGLSMACQRLCEKAKKDSYDYIILFDQDSRINEESIDALKNVKDSEIIIEEKIKKENYINLLAVMNAIILINASLNLKIKIIITDIVN